MMTELIAAHAAKLGILSSISMLLLAEVGALGLPGGWVLVSLLVNVFCFGWYSHGFLGSLVGGLNPPTEASSPAYRRFYSSANLLFHRSPKDVIAIVAKGAE